MQSVLSVAFPLFAMIGSGYLIVKKNIISRETINGLILIVFWLFLPAFIFTNLLGADIGSIPDFSFIISYYMASGIVFLISTLIGKYYWNLQPREIVIRSLASVAGIVGYMGLPVIILVIGKEAILPAVALVITDKVFVVVGGTLMLEACGDREARQSTHWRDVTKQVLRAVVTSPLLIAVVLGVIFISAGWQLLQPMEFFLEQFALATAPCALVALGATLSGYQIDHEKMVDISQVVALKSLLFPLLVFLMGYYIFDLPKVVLEVSLIMAATPVATNVFILASKYRVYVKEVSSEMLFTTVLSIFLISGILIVMN